MRYVLASNSPRRKELLRGIGIDFEIKVLPDIDESYPEALPKQDVAVFIAQKKAEAYTSVIEDDTTVITADTVVVCQDEIMGKPHDRDDAHRMLRKLSGKTHQVYTGVCLLTKRDGTLGKQAFSVCTDVTFKELSDEEIYYYIDNHKPYDKAGAYGIQEWIGYIGVTGINGSYFNVMGLPVQRIYEALR